MFWPIFWILCIIALIASVGVTAFREKKAQKEARKKIMPQPMEADLDPDVDPMAEPDGFGDPEMAEFDADGGEQLAGSDETANR